MKFTMQRPIEIEVAAIRLELPVRYDEEDIPANFPLRKGDMWIATVDMDTGRIRDWPGGSGYVHMKVVDEGVYVLLGANDVEIARIQDYVPNDIVPGKWGDYVELTIADGVITNWPKKPDLSAFFPQD